MTSWPIALQGLPGRGVWWTAVLSDWTERKGGAEETGLSQSPRERVP